MIVCGVYFLFLTNPLIFGLSDPGDNVGFSDLLFDNEVFANALKGSLNQGGVFIAQTGVASGLVDPSTMNSREKHSHIFKTRLEQAGFETIKEYEDVSNVHILPNASIQSWNGSQ